MRRVLIGLVLATVLPAIGLAQENDKAAGVSRTDAAAVTLTGTVTYVSNVLVTDAGDPVREIYIRSVAMPTSLSAGIICTGAWVQQCGTFRVGRRISITGKLLPIQVDDTGGSPLFTVIPLKVVGGV